jgi:hypothetical protein
MDQTTEQIESQIHHKRRALRSNLQELEDKARSVTDWRQQVRANPAAMLAVAFVGGMFAARIMPRRSHRGSRISHPTEGSERVSARGDQFTHEWNNVQGALIGVAANKFKDALAELVPGFGEQLAEAAGAGRAAAQRQAEAHGGSVQGEGDYQAAREYRRGVEEYVRTADIERAARAAAPRDEREAAELEAAEQEGRRGTPRQAPPGARGGRHR